MGVLDSSKDMLMAKPSFNFSYAVYYMHFKILLWLIMVRSHQNADYC
jgi:hypothetical protein